MDAARHVPAGSLSDPGRKTDITSVCRLVHSHLQRREQKKTGLALEAGLRKVTQRYDTIRYDTRGTNANKSFNESFKASPHVSFQLQPANRIANRIPGASDVLADKLPSPRRGKLVGFALNCQALAKGRKVGWNQLGDQAGRLVEVIIIMLGNM
ncbi:predicted protein [Histoplasma capsulatum var. duboisii H88]|uniref:Predicted protein n=1 Tax=Ajellomyces capsulatus (strain H88) TaxID=544711 RepID=F0UD10_AJEC8|nr:predicted protein [Histoplasma capsulatum var. duboisii H88]